MASLSGASGYSIRANGRMWGGWAAKLACDLDGGVGLPSKRDFATRVQPLHGAAADRVPANLSIAGAGARGNKLHRTAYGIHGGILVRHGSRSERVLMQRAASVP